MGLTKQYLRWEPSAQFGIVGSQCSAISFVHQWADDVDHNGRHRGNICATAACENLLLWNLKTGQQIEKLTTELNESQKSHPISCTSYSVASNVLCCGHNDGSIRVFDCGRFEAERLKVVFAAHRGNVSCISFDSDGLKIASGGRDTEIAVWDVVSLAGLFRLKGHKGPINKVEFMKQHPWVLVTSSNDTFIKFWDLNTQHCFKTLVAHQSEVWSFVLLKDDTRMISGSSDSELKVWKVTFSDDEDDPELFHAKAIELKKKRLKKLELLGESSLNEHEIDDDGDDLLLIEHHGTIVRKSTQRLTGIFVDSTERLLIFHGRDNFAECYKIRNHSEIQSKIKKRLRKARKRQTNEDENFDEATDDAMLNQESTLSDEIEKFELLRASFKIRSLDLLTISGRQEFRIAFLLNNNSIECHRLSFSNNSMQTDEIAKISDFGHRTDIRSISISSDSLSIVSTSFDSIKLWSRSSCRCVSTITENIDQPLCSIFAPGDKHLIVGTKNGNLQVIGLTDLQVQSTVVASESGQQVLSICMLPDMTGIVSGSEDRCVKFWSFDLVLNDEDNSKFLTLNEERTLNNEEGVICTKVSSNSKFLAVSLLDSTVKIYFCDSLKFFLTLYGHKLPVLCMDISSDSSLIVTGSSDKNIKIWGMDFGDCHRSLFAHDDNVTCISFVPKTHYFFTASKDSNIKMWDADLREKIITFDNHHAEVVALAIAPNGKYLVSASRDKSIRILNKTNEPLILAEEQELEHEREYERQFNQNDWQTVVAGEQADQQESSLAQKKTTNTVRSVERLIESIDIFEVERQKLEAYQKQLQIYESKMAVDDEDSKSNLAKPVREPIDPYLMVYRTECPYRFMLEILLKIKSNEFEETLLELPFNYTCQLLVILSELLQRRWEVELVCRCICFLLRTNFGQITSTSSMSSLVDKVRGQMKLAVRQMNDLIGVNTIGLEYYQRIFDEREDVTMFTELLAQVKLNKHKKRKKSKFNAAPIVTWT